MRNFIRSFGKLPLIFGLIFPLVFLANFSAQAKIPILEGMYADGGTVVYVREAVDVNNADSSRKWYEIRALTQTPNGVQSTLFYFDANYGGVSKTPWLRQRDQQDSGRFDTANVDDFVHVGQRYMAFSWRRGGLWSAEVEYLNLTIALPSGHVSAISATSEVAAFRHASGFHSGPLKVPGIDVHGDRFDYCESALR